MKKKSKRTKTFFGQTIVLFVILTLYIFFVSCSSAPKRAMEKTEITDNAYSRLSLANTELSKSDFVSAKNDLQFAYNASVSVDNADLLTKISLTRITLENAASTEDKKSIKEKCESYLQDAKDYSSRSSNPELFNSICTLYEVRIHLIDSSDLEMALSLCNQIEKKISSEKQYLAYLYRTRGEIYLVQNKNSSAAEQFILAANLHTKERCLSEIGVDWYFAARVYSRDGKKQEALDCLQKALKYDRLDENTTGIASDYYGLAIVLLDNNPTENEKKLAKKYAEYSALVYKSGGFDSYAERSLTLLKQF